MTDEQVVDAFVKKAMDKGVPETTAGALARFYFYGIQPGGFLTAVLSNDLKSAVAHADTINFVAIGAIVKFLYNGVPVGCWGSPDKFNDWPETAEKEGVQALATYANCC